MGSQADYWTDIYARTHEQRLAQSMQFARDELAAKYGAAQTYAQYQQDLLKMYEEELTKAQKALLEYDEKRGGKQGSVDDTAKLLAVMADAGNTIARETGEAAQRRLEAEASVEGRYRLSSEQSNAIGRAGDYFGKVDVASITTSPDVQRNIDAAIAEIGPGSFASGTDAAKTGTAELYARLNSALSSNSAYNSDPSLKKYLAEKVAQKMGTNSAFILRTTVDADKASAVTSAKTEAGKTGTGTSAEAAKIAKDLIGKKLQMMSPEQIAAFSKFQEKYGGMYFDLIKEGATIGEAKAQIKEGLDATGAEEFEKSFESARTALAEGGDQDIQKFFDPAYVGAYSRSIKLGSATTKAREDFAGAVEALKTPPTEEDARRRGAQIYEPISPGVGRRTREATSRLEERAQTSRITGLPMSDEDYMASRILSTAPQLPDEERIIAGASAAAIRALNKGWTPDEGRAARASVDAGQMTIEEFEALGMGGPASPLGYRLYSNVKEKQLRDTSPKGIVRYASDLAGGDQGLRDAVLQEYYKHAGYEMRGTTVVKAKADVEKAETSTEPRDLSGIKLEDAKF